MGKIIEMLLPFMLLGISCLSSVMCNYKWLTFLPDSQQLNTLAFLGTHDTASYGTSIIYAQTQSTGMSAQLESGIRVFDMRVRRTSNVFAMHHDLIYLGMMFGDLVRDIRNYLQTNPKEFVIMFMQEEYTAESSTMSECEILKNKYLKDWPNLFVQHWSINDTIGQHRGKILLARANRGFWGCVTSLPCKEQNHYELNSEYKIADKMNDIKALQAEVSATPHYYQCYINYLSGNGGPLLTPKAITSDLYELTYIAVHYGDPIVSEPGINNMMVSIFHNPRNTLYIIMADFPSPLLISTVVNSNNSTSDH